MRNAADVTGGKAIAVLLQSTSDIIASGKMWVSWRNICDVSATPSGIKRELCMYLITDHCECCLAVAIAHWAHWPRSYRAGLGLVWNAYLYLVVKEGKCKKWCNLAVFCTSLIAALVTNVCPCSLLSGVRLIFLPDIQPALGPRGGLCVHLLCNP
jgi:hypothetical protein